MNKFRPIDFNGMISALLVNNNVDGSIDKLGVQIPKLQPSVRPGSECKVDSQLLNINCLAEADDDVALASINVPIITLNFIQVHTFKLPRGSKHMHDNINHQGDPHGHPLNSNESEFYKDSHILRVHSHPEEPRVLNATNVEPTQGRPQEFEEVIVTFLDGDPQKPYYWPLAF